MSAALKREISAKEESRKCAARFWRLFPHLLLSLSLVAYAFLGAFMFERIEGRSENTFKGEYREFLGEIVSTVHNLTANASNTQADIVDGVEVKMRKFKSIWMQRPERWDLFGSMFFCCTVFTTVGYGEIYPVTLTGKVVCVLYAMVGIPLMLLVILDVGDFLASMMSRAYVRIHTLRKSFGSRTWSPHKALKKKDREQSAIALEDGTIFFSHDLVVHEPLDIRHVMQSQKDVRQKSIQLQNNKEIFEKILARENLLRKSPLLRSLSCPELDRLPKPRKGCAIWDFTGLGDGMETLNVPFVLILFIVFAYILFGGLILPLWEKEFKDFDPYYFCFITLTTIGFGDIVPNHPKYFMLVSLFIIVGMAIMSMAFKLSQTRIVSFYRQFIKFISRGNVETFEIQRNE